MRVSILQGDATGSEVFKEIYNPNPVTNSNGLVSLEIGSGIPIINSFESIDWGSGPLYIKIETDPTGGTNYSVTGTSQLLSVPYALYSKTAENYEPSWSLTGNDGIVSGTNFLGTMDDQPLDFRTNNLLHTRISAKGQIEPHNTGNSVFLGIGAGNADDLTDNKNVFVGYQTGYSNVTGENNTALGNMALHYNSSGYSNVAIGVEALKNNTERNHLVAIGDSALYWNGSGMLMDHEGICNTGVGSKALFSNTIGSWNTAIGFNALDINSSGNANTGIGSGALSGNQTGSNNTSVGSSSLAVNSNGCNNTSIGQNSLRLNSIGNNNTAIGCGSLYSFDDGNDNTAIGNGALNNLLGGNGNTTIGSYSNTQVLFPSNSTAIGYGSLITASNQIHMGNSSVTSIGGYTNWSNISDVRFKKEIQELVPGLDFILKLRPIIYHLDLEKLAAYFQTPDTMRSLKDEKEKESIVQTGFSAQEVEEAANSIGYDFSGVDKPKNEKDLYGLRYAEFVVPLVKAVQEQQAMIEDQKILIHSLQARIEKLEETK
jgi:hypothetical protein